MWNQIYNPLDSAVLSTIAAALPVIVLLVLIASGKVKAHIAAIVALVVANIITIAIFHMPTGMSIRASLLGVVSGFFPIGWIVLNVIFLYQVTVSTGRFELLKRAVGGVTEDRRLQLLLIAFSFGAFFEGASGFGTPVAITGSIPLRLGFSPLAGRGPRPGHRPRSLYPRRHGRPAAAAVLADRAVLGGVGVRRMEGHEGCLAGDPGHRTFIRDPAIRDFELHQSLDRRHRRVADFDGLPDPVPEGLAAEATLAVAGLARQRRVGLDHGDAEAARQD